MLIRVMLFLVIFSVWIRGSIGAYDCGNKGKSCNTACVVKSIVDATNYDYDLQKYGVQMTRQGCEGQPNFETLIDLKCDIKENDGFPYSMLYTFKYHGKSLTVRKRCCFTIGCNARAFFENPRYVFVPHVDIPKTIQSLLVDSFFLFVIYGLILTVLFIIILQRYYVYATARFLVKRDDYYTETEVAMKELNEFNQESLMDTRIKITGCMTIAELSKVLALFPDDLRVSGSSRAYSCDESNEEASGHVKKMTARGLPLQIERPLMAHCVGIGHELLDTGRFVSTPRDLLYRLVEHGPYQYPFDIIELLQLFDETTYILASEPSLLTLGGGITIVGDLRGRYVDLHRWLQLTGWPPNNKLLFLGGMVDIEEKGSLETLALICALKCRFPRHVYMLRGVPEASEFRIPDRYDAKIVRSIQSSVGRVFSYLPYTALIGGSIMAMHSGFSPLCRTVADLNRIERPVRNEAFGKIEKHIMFNKPSAAVKMFRPNPASEGDNFGKQAVLRVCKLFNIKTIVRSHSVVPYGYMPCWRHRLVNIWSAPGVGTSQGAVLWVSQDLSVTPVVLKSRERV